MLGATHGTSIRVPGTAKRRGESEAAYLVLEQLELVAQLLALLPQALRLRPLLLQLAAAVRVLATPSHRVRTGLSVCGLWLRAVPIRSGSSRASRGEP